MKLGIDVDGVICDFYSGYERIIRDVTGKDLFPKRAVGEYPPTWDWPEYHGYSSQDIQRTWQVIQDSPDFWQNLTALPDLRAAMLIDTTKHDVYYITARPGKTAKLQTELWFMDKWEFFPTVLISPQKGLCCAALDLDVYIDDRLENIQDVMETSPTTTALLIDRPYNQCTLSMPRAISLEKVATEMGLR